MTLHWYAQHCFDTPRQVRILHEVIGKEGEVFVQFLDDGGHCRVWSSQLHESKEAVDEHYRSMRMNLLGLNRKRE